MGSGERLSPPPESSWQPPGHDMRQDRRQPRSGSVDVVAMEIIAGTPPGGGQDRTARAIAGILDTEVTITNVPGRGGGNAWDRLIAGKGATHLGAGSPPA